MNAGTKAQDRQSPRPRGQSHVCRRAAGCLLVVLLAAVACTNTTLDLVDPKPPDASFFDPSLGLLAHWALDEAQAGSPAADSSGFGHSGAPSTNPPVPTTDLPPVHFPNSHSLSFNGVDQWIEMGNPALLNVGGPVSVAAWVRPMAIDNYRDVVSHGYWRNPDYSLSLRIHSSTYQFTYWDSADHLASAPVPASDVGAWVHLCGVFDGTTYSVYRNGALAASAVDKAAPPANVDAIWAIGARAPQSSGGVDYQLQGQIDDVRIYGRALTAKEVEELYRR